MSGDALDGILPEITLTVTGIIFRAVHELAIERCQLGAMESNDLTVGSMNALNNRMQGIGAIPIDGNGSLPETVRAASQALRRLCLQGESID